MSNLILSALTAIQANNPTVLQNIVDSFPLEKMEVEKADRLLIRLLTEASRLRRDRMIEILLQAWDDSTPDDEQYSVPTFARLFLNPGIEDAVLRVMVEELTMTTVELLTDLIKADARPELAMGLRRVVDLTGGLSFQEFQALSSVAVQEENYLAEEFFRGQMEGVAPSAPRPPWLRAGDQTHQELVAGLPDYPLQPMNLNEALDQFKEGFGQLGETEEEIEENSREVETVFRFLTVADRQERIEPLEKREQALQMGADEQYYQVWGPANVRVGERFDSDSRCSKYGGCRMLLCNCHEPPKDMYPEDIEDDLVEEDRPWFDDNCNTCRLKIDHFWQAIRMPLPHGGWIGTYCSFECLEGAQDRPDRAVKLMIQYLEKKMMEIGILDRRE